MLQPLFLFNDWSARHLFVTKTCFLHNVINIFSPFAQSHTASILCFLAQIHLTTLLSSAFISFPHFALLLGLYSLVWCVLGTGTGSLRRCAGTASPVWIRTTGKHRDEANRCVMLPQFELRLKIFSFTWQSMEWQIQEWWSLVSK